MSPFSGGNRFFNIGTHNEKCCCSICIFSASGHNPTQNVEQLFLFIHCIQSDDRELSTNLQTVTSFLTSWFMSQNELQKVVVFFWGGGGGVIFSRILPRDSSR